MGRTSNFVRAIYKRTRAEESVAIMSGGSGARTAAGLAQALKDATEEAVASKRKLADLTKDHEDLVVSLAMKNSINEGIVLACEQVVTDANKRLAKARRKVGGAKMEAADELLGSSDAVMAATLAFDDAEAARQNIEQASQKQLAAAAIVDTKPVQGTVECCVCFQTVKLEWVILPCMHTKICEGCITKADKSPFPITGGNCPMCRGHTQRVKKLF